MPGNIHSGVSGNDSIMATGVFSARELSRVTRCKFYLYSLSKYRKYHDQNYRTTINVFLFINNVFLPTHDMDHYRVLLLNVPIKHCKFSTLVSFYNDAT